MYVQARWGKGRFTYYTDKPKPEKPAGNDIISVRFSKTEGGDGDSVVVQMNRIKIRNKIRKYATLRGLYASLEYYSPTFGKFLIHQHSRIEPAAKKDGLGFKGAVGKSSIVILSAAKLIEEAGMLQSTKDGLVTHWTAFYIAKLFAQQLADLSENGWMICGEEDAIPIDFEQTPDLDNLTGESVHFIKAGKNNGVMYPRQSRGLEKP
ncbi:MAG: hypothetical protein ABH871_01460 [Pseudomonadota bacterium]